MTRAVPLFRVLETVELVGEGQNRFRQHFPFFGIYGELAFVCSSNRPPNSNDITSVSPVFEILAAMAVIDDKIEEEKKPKTVQG